MTDERTGMDYLVLVERPTPRPGTVQEWVSIIVTATDPHAAVRAVMALILTRRCGPSWTRRQAYGR